MTFKQALTAHVKTDKKSIKLVDKYVARELERPKTKWGVPVSIGLLMLVLPLAVGALLLLCFPSISAVLCYVLAYLLVDLPLLRLFLIKLIRCYQHYAKEELRRFCMCMPSCSEYSIGVLKKYPLIVAIFKIIVRLTVICDGEKKIDLP